MTLKKDPRFPQLLASACLAAFLAAMGLGHWAEAQSKRVCIGMTMPFGGLLADLAEETKDGALLAIEEANAHNGVAGYHIDTVTLNTFNTTTGTFDPALAAEGARKLQQDNCVVANIGPLTSGEAKAMSAILSEGDLATLTPATNPDITDPKFAEKLRPMGKVVVFRSETTDAYQAPEMANFFAEKLHVHKVYIIDDAGDFGIGLASAFEKQAKAKAMVVLGHDQVNPLEADYATILTKISAAGAEALYFGGAREAGVKMMKQSRETMPAMIKGSGDGLYGGLILKSAGFPASEGWYVTIASPYVLEDPVVRPWVQRFVARWGRQPSSSSIMAYDDALVILDAVKRVGASGQSVDRHTIRTAIQNTHLRTVQGPIAYDANGDLQTHVISLFQIQHNPKFPDDDILHQYKYLGQAPAR